MQINKVWPAIAIVALLVGCSGMATVSDTAGAPLIGNSKIVNAANRIEDAKELYKNIGGELLALRQSGAITNDDLWAKIKQADSNANVAIKEAMAALDEFKRQRDSGTLTKLDEALVWMDYVLLRLQLRENI